MKYWLSLGHFSTSVQQNCFQNTLKKYPFDYFTQAPNSNDSNDESNSNNRDSLIPNDDESNVLDDDQNVSQTFHISLKIKSLFQLIYYNIHNGKKNTIAHNELKCTLWKMQESRIAHIF